MIHVFYTQSVRKINIETFDFYFNQLPSGVQTKILRYRNWQDAQRSLLGKALLMHALKDLKINKTLGELKFTALEKPYFDDISFNITHSGEFVLCAISRTDELGVDIEEIKSIPLEDFRNNFSVKEWQEITKDDNDLYCFYKFWTQKESFLKAIGMGLNVPLKQAEIINNKIVWQTKEWFFNELNLDERYVSHLSTREAIPEIVIQKRHYN